MQGGMKSVLKTWEKFDKIIPYYRVRIMTVISREPIKYLWVKPRTLYM